MQRWTPVAVNMALLSSIQIGILVRIGARVELLFGLNDDGPARREHRAMDVQVIGLEGQSRKDRGHSQVLAIGQVNHGRGHGSRARARTHELSTFVSFRRGTRGIKGPIA